MFEQSRIVKLRAMKYTPVSEDSVETRKKNAENVVLAFSGLVVYPGTVTACALTELAKQNTTTLWDKHEHSLRIHTHDIRLVDDMEALAAHVQDRFTAFVNYSLLKNMYTLVVTHKPSLLTA